MKQKFEECAGCRFFSRRPNHTNPICGECGNGEFFEEKTRSRQPSEDELMNLFGRMHRDD